MTAVSTDFGRNTRLAVPTLMWSVLGRHDELDQMEHTTMLAAVRRIGWAHQIHATTSVARDIPKIERIDRSFVD